MNKLHIHNIQKESTEDNPECRDVNAFNKSLSC